MGGARCAELDNLCTLVPPRMLFILRAESAFGAPLDAMPWGLGIWVPVPVSGVW
jgi:hypothetical protein